MSVENIFRTIVILLFLSGASISIYYRHKAQRSGQDKISLREEDPVLMVALRVAGLGIWGVVIAYMLNPTWVSWARWPLPLWLRWAGVALGAASWVMLVWMFRSLGNNITPTVITRKEHQLITCGPYRWIRHPLYTFASLLCLSLGLISAVWLIPLMSLLGFPILAARTTKEEEHLLQRFGDQYRQYMERTGRFLPRLQ